MKKLKENTLKGQRAITLIALVVTIIVLLILAGISIAMLTGQNGILNRASEAKRVSGVAQAEEELQLAVNALAADYYRSGSNRGTFRDYIFSTEAGKGQEKIKAELGASNISFDSENNQITYKGYLFNVAEKGSLSRTENENENTNTNTENTSTENTSNENTTNNSTESQEIHPTTMTISSTGNLTVIDIGEKLQLSLSTDPASITDSITWSSSNNNIASVSNTGLVTGKAEGNVTITATAKNSNNQVTKTATIALNIETFKVPDTPINFTTAFSNGNLNWQDVHNIAKIISNRFGMGISGINKTTQSATVEYNGEYIKLNVGDEIALTGTNNKTYNVRIIGFNTDKLASSSNYDSPYSYSGVYAGISFEFLDYMSVLAYNDYLPFNNSFSNSGGWGASSMRTNLNRSDNLSKLSSMQYYIKEVEKEYNKGNRSTELSVSPAVSKLWVLACSEIYSIHSKGWKNDGWYGGCRCNESTMTDGIDETRYAYYTTVNADYNVSCNSLIKKDANGTDIDYWLRSPNTGTSTNYCIIYRTGIIDSIGADSAWALVFPCFCI